ncbi:hypothetical protein [uncultured Pelagimonas sp.]|uniref:hypothetical protein n=1 Tax=uncultured Pelagimonas sp. TaxID=1618102 RepID=UPI0026200515|nr:hypothetical protein [uncultured Pelagimonas sp.]
MEAETKEDRAMKAHMDKQAAAIVAVAGGNPASIALELAQVNALASVTAFALLERIEEFANGIFELDDDQDIPTDVGLDLVSEINTVLSSYSKSMQKSPLINAAEDATSDKIIQPKKLFRP